MRILACLALFLSVLFGEVKFASFNTENLFDGINNGNEYKEFKIGACQSQMSQSECNLWRMRELGKAGERYEAKLTDVAKVLRELAADTVAVQEVENEAVLRELAKRAGYEFYKFASVKNSPVGLGFLSHLPLKNARVEEIRGVKTRPILSVDVSVGGATLTLVNVHLPAYSNGLKKRTIAAEVVQKVALNSRNVILLGDFNSQYKIGTKGDFLLIDLITQNDFYNLWDDAPKSFKSHKKGAHKNGKIDNVMLSPEILHLYKKGSFGVFEASVETSDHKPVFFVMEERGGEKFEREKFDDGELELLRKRRK